MPTSPDLESDAAEPFLPDAAPSWVARGLSVVLLAVFVATLLASVNITLPETVSSPFMLVLAHGADPVRAARGGTITAVRIVEGQRVQRGAPVFVIRSSVVGDRAAELRTL